MELLNQLRRRWNAFKDESPVRARAIAVSFLIGLPVFIFIFMCACIGLMRTAIGLIYCSFGSTLVWIVGWFIDNTCGAIANYVLFGEFENSYGWSVIEYWENYKQKQR